MPTRKEILQIGGREVSISNPDKVYFPKAGHTKLDLVRYFMAVADGALTGVRGRPMALKRFVNGAAGEAFFQKRAPDNRPDWLRTVTLSFPSGRTADEIELGRPACLEEDLARVGDHDIAIADAEDLLFLRHGAMLPWPARSPVPRGRFGRCPFVVLPTRAEGTPRTWRSDRCSTWS